LGFRVWNSGLLQEGGGGYVRKGGNRIGNRWGKEEIVGEEKG